MEIVGDLVLKPRKEFLQCKSLRVVRPLATGDLHAIKKSKT
jgi:hypothetical protein